MKQSLGVKVRKLLTPVIIPLLRWRNAVDYPLRQFFHWRRPGGYPIKDQSKTNLFDYLEGDSRTRVETQADRLLRSYCLADLYAHSPRNNYRENLYYLDLITTAFERASVHLPNPLQAADIGVSHWFYVQALFAALTWYPPGKRLHSSPKPGRSVSLKGYETDAYRVYNTLFSRYDHAAGHLQGLPETVVYLPQAFTRRSGQFDLVTLFFPFVFEVDHLGWGLPLAAFNPDQLMADAWNSLKAGGTLLVVNQGEAEHQAEKERFKRLIINPAAAYKHEPSQLFRYPVDRYVLAAAHG